MSDTLPVPTPPSLPDKPSALIRLALEDLAKCEALPERFAINMGQWHSPGESKCHVCLAGAVMAQTLGAPDWQDVDPLRYGPGNGDKLSALDYFRQGAVGMGLGRMGFLPPGAFVARFASPPSYAAYPAYFRIYMEDLAAKLEGFGL